MLALDVEFLTGVCIASRDPSDVEPDWPPQIDRIFSALVATWAAHSEPTAERTALEWLEVQAPPTIRASDMYARTAPPVFVPPNDATSAQLHVLPSFRRRQERRFPAAIPVHSTASYIWPDAEPEDGVLESLQSLARDTPYVGQSTSIVRCFFHKQANVATHPNVSERPSTRRIYGGRLQELITRFDQGLRPALGESVALDTASASPGPASFFGSEWHVFADAGGACPDLRGAPLAARALRTAIMSGFDGSPVPEVISGHTADGRPTTKPHMAIFPLANVGWKWADGRLMGMAVCLPRDASRSDENALFSALGVLMRRRGGERLGEIEVDLPGTAKWRLVRQAEPKGSSLQPSRYVSPARAWATATPIALDRHPKQTGNQALQDEIAGLIADTCERVGLPKPRIVVPDKHSAVRGTAPARPSPRSPAWMHWALPGPLRGKVLTHATIVFDEPVLGPIALGAGRFIGLGLCLPIDREPRE